jgi:hypothetical protein
LPVTMLNKTVLCNIYRTATFLNSAPSRTWREHLPTFTPERSLLWERKPPQWNTTVLCNKENG